MTSPLKDIIEQSEKEFDEKFLEIMQRDDGYSQERESLKSFLRSSRLRLIQAVREQIETMMSKIDMHGYGSRGFSSVADDNRYIGGKARYEVLSDILSLLTEASK